MITWYTENHKAYRLVDIDTNLIIFSRYVVVDEETRPFHTSLKFIITIGYPVMAKDSGVKLQVASPKKGKY